MGKLEKKKKILLLARYPVGGIRTYFRYIYRNDAFDRYEFVIITPEESLDTFFSEVFSGKSYRYVKCGESSLDMLRALWRIIRTERIDLVHSHGFTAGVLASIPCRFMKIVHLMTAHDVFLEDQFRGVKGRLKHGVMQTAFTLVNRIHAVSQDGKDNISEFFPMVDASKISVILHGIDAERFYTEKPVQIDGVALDEGAFLIGFLGRFMAQKGFRTLVSAVEVLSTRALPRKPLVITFGWGGFVREDTEYIKNKGLSANFRMLPFTDNVAGSIKALDCIVMPSRWEACGLLGMEVLTAGVPLLASNCIGLREVTAGSPALTFPVGSAEELADRIQDCMAAYDHVKEMATAYSEVARERFDSARAANQLFRLYIEMTSNGVE